MVNNINSLARSSMWYVACLTMPMFSQIGFTSMIMCCIHKGAIEKKEGIAKVNEGVSI
jgi:hypothetical protein